MRIWAYFGVLELLFDFVHEATTDLADKASVEQLWSYFARSGHSPADTHESTDFVGSEIPDP